MPYETLVKLDCGSNQGERRRSVGSRRIHPREYNHGKHVVGQPVEHVDCRPTYHGVLSGTSFSAPIVTGLVALYLEDNPYATPTDVLPALKDGAANLGDIDGDGQDDLLVQTPGHRQPKQPTKRRSPATTRSPAPRTRRSPCCSPSSSPTTPIPTATRSGCARSPSRPTARYAGPTRPAWSIPRIPGFVGQDSFTYTVTDGRDLSAPATVTLTVVAEPGNQAPVGAADFFDVEQGDTLTMPYTTLFANDYDPDGDTLQLYDYTQPAHGTVTTGSSSLIYTPAFGYTGSDAFTYRLSDALTVSAPIAVSIDVRTRTSPRWPETMTSSSPTS